MKEITINTNSWHYRLIRMWGFYPSTDDICAYTRAMLLALMITVFSFSAATGMLSALVDFGTWLVVWALTGIMVDITQLGQYGAAELMIGAAIGLGLLAHRLTTKVELSEDTQAMWDSVRHKICVRINYS